MRFRDGSGFAKALFAGLILLYLLGVAIALGDKLGRVGRPDVGWVMDGLYVTPTRADAAAELNGGGIALSVNGSDTADESFRREIWPRLRTGIGDTNDLVLRGPGGRVVEARVPVRALEWSDVIYAEGPTIALGALFFAVGVVSFLVRPFAAGSWAFLSICCVVGGLLTTLYLRVDAAGAAGAVYFRVLVGLVGFVPLHGALAFPVVHPLLLARPHVLWLLYGVAFGHSVLQVLAWHADWAGPLRHVGPLDNVLLLLTILFFVGRCALAARSADALVAQRARILLAGVLAGGVPFTVLSLLRTSFGVVLVDMRFAYWSLALFLLAIGYITVRHDLLNARVAVRRAIIYAAVVVVLTEAAILLIALRTYAAALLLFPLLYWWPRFDARLDRWLYPKRTRLPELVREVGEEMASCTTVEAVLDVLAAAPERISDARGAVAFLFSLAGGENERVRAAGEAPLPAGPPLAGEPLIRLVATTRKEVLRDHIALEPQYSRIADRCYACFERLGAEVLLPITRHDEVIGGLAASARRDGDGYGQVDLDALSTVVQQAVQSLIRIEATERLRRRELEFADLKRFFPPQIIEQVMARGGAAELRSQRKLVTVLFADLRGFTAFSDRVEPEEVTATLEEYHRTIGRRISEHAGTLEHFAGDGLMVFFNDPVDQPDHVERAGRLALAVQADVRVLREAWARKGYPIDLGIGIDTGYATCGFVGYEGRREYAVIGNVTNLAARLSDAAAAGEVLVTARVRAELDGGFRVEPVGELTLKGFHQPQPVFRLLPGAPRVEAA